MNFAQLGLAAPLLKAVEGEGYTIPTPIQAQAIPAVLAGSDLLGIAQTGTGKTAAFALPILHRLADDRRPAPRKGCRVLVLSPTRELASQIAESFEVYGRNLRMSVATVFGGVKHRPQIQALSRGVDILVATPGRLIDHLDEGDAELSGTEIFVLDEADQMLDLGFIKPIRRIVSQMVHRRQNLFFSATMPREIASLASDLLRDPVRIAVTPVASTSELVTQRVIHIEGPKKRGLLVELLSKPEMARTLVFARTKRGADRVTRHLDEAGLSAASIHGNKSQKQREEALAAFRAGKIRALIATDIAARGIDVDAVSHVINFELPDVPEAYVHRIGRTARAGATGQAISFCDAGERDLLRAIERLTRQSIPSEDRRGDASIAADTAASRAADRRSERPAQRTQRDGRPARSSQRDDRAGPRTQRDEHPARGAQRDDRAAPRTQRDDRPARSVQRDDRPTARNGASAPARPRRPEGSASQAAAQRTSTNPGPVRYGGSTSQPSRAASGARAEAPRSSGARQSQGENRTGGDVRTGDSQSETPSRGRRRRRGGSGTGRNAGRSSYQPGSSA